MPLGRRYSPRFLVKDSKPRKPKMLGRPGFKCLIQVWLIYPMPSHGFFVNLAAKFLKHKVQWDRPRVISHTNFKAWTANPVKHCSQVTRRKTCSACSGSSRLPFRRSPSAISAASLVSHERKESRTRCLAAALCGQGASKKRPTPNTSWCRVWGTSSNHRLEKLRYK